MAASARSSKDGKLLRLLRSAGFKEDLLPTTAGWLDTHPVFQWLTEHLSSDNFVSPDVAAAYAELSLQGDKSSAKQSSMQGLVSAMGLSDDDSGSDSDDEQQDPLSYEQLQAAVEAKQQYISTLESQLGSLSAVSSRMSTSLQQQHTQSTLLPQLTAHGASQLHSARTNHHQQQQALAAQLSVLYGVLQRLQQLMQDQPSNWLLPVRDMTEYAVAHMDEQQQFERGMQLLTAAVGAGPLTTEEQPSMPATPSYLSLQQLHPTIGSVAAAAAAALDQPGASWGRYVATSGSASSATPLRTPRGTTSSSPLPLTPRGTAGAAAAAGSGGGGGTAAEGGGYLTPRGALAMAGSLTPRQTTSAAGVGAVPLQTPRRARAAADAVRHRDQEERNRALQKEMKRQRCAFKLVLEEYVKAQSELAAARGKVAALEAVLANPASPLAGTQITALQREVEQLERSRLELAEDVLPAAVERLARGNDVEILKSDYAKHLAKLTASLQRKQTFCEQLLGSISRHLLLGLLQQRQQQQLEDLRCMLALCQQLLGGFTAAAAARGEACRALAQEALAPRYSVQQGDSHLQHLAALVMGPGGAAEGGVEAPALEAPDQQQQHDGGDGSSSNRAAAAGGSLLTPQGQRNMSAAPCTPRRLGINQLVSSIQSLSTALTSGPAAVQQLLLHQLPHLAEQAAAACQQLHDLVFPGTPFPPTAAAGAAAVCGDSSGALQPVLTDPAVAEAAQAVDALAEELARSINSITDQQVGYAKILEQGKAEQQLQRRVMALFFMDPEQLAAEVGGLQEQMEVLGGPGGALGGESSQQW